MSETKDQNIIHNEQILIDVYENFVSKKKGLSPKPLYKIDRSLIKNPILNKIKKIPLIGGIIGAVATSGVATGANAISFIGGSLLMGPLVGAIIGGGASAYFMHKTAVERSFKKTVDELLNTRKKVKNKQILIPYFTLIGSTSILRIIMDNNMLSNVVFVPENFYPKTSSLVLLDLSNCKTDNFVNILDLTPFSNNDPYFNKLPYEIRNKNFEDPSLSYRTTTQKIISNNYSIYKNQYGDNFILGKEIFNFKKGIDSPVVYNSSYNKNYIFFITNTVKKDFYSNLSHIERKSTLSVYQELLLNYPIEKLSLNEQCDFIASKYNNILKVNEQLKSESVELKSIKEDFTFVMGTFNHSIRGVLNVLVSSTARLVAIIEDNPQIKTLKKKNKYAKQDLSTVSNIISSNVERVDEEIKYSTKTFDNVGKWVKKNLDLIEFIRGYEKLDGKFDYEFIKDFNVEKKGEFPIMVNVFGFKDIVRNLITNVFEHAFDSKSKNLLKMSLVNFTNGLVVFSISNSGNKFKLSKEEFFTHGKSSKEGDRGKGGAIIKRHLIKNEINLEIVHLEDDEYRTRIDLYIKIAK